MVKELRRLLPGAEPGLVLRSDPSWLLRCGCAWSLMMVHHPACPRRGSISCFCVSGHLGCSGCGALGTLQQWTALSSHVPAGPGM